MRPSSRFISPSRSELDRLRTPLEPGERRVFEWLDANLAPAWEIYVQPHLNGLRPDFVLLHPQAGVIVLEIKDWNLEAMSYRMKIRDGAAPHLEIKTPAGWKSHEKNNPITKLNLYRDEIQTLYCPSLAGANMHRLVSCAAIFPRALHAEVVSILQPSLDHFFDLQNYPMNCAIAGSDDLQTDELGKVLRVALSTKQSGMTEAIADELRHWLIEPEYSAEQRVTPELSPDQKHFAESRTTTGYRRIKGAAGSGKSLVLAARAAALIAADKKVLVVSYNLTLLNYLQDLVVRWPMPAGVHARKDIVWLNFHAWCKRIFLTVGETDSYRALWSTHFKAAESKAAKEGLDHDQLEVLLNEKMAQCLNQAITDHPELIDHYDAILVDEGQDYRPSWIALLRRSLADGGEYLLVADKSQNIYGTARFLTDEAMGGCGFRGDWAEVKECYRIPSQFIPLVADFAKRFLPADTRDLPIISLERQQQLNFEPCFPRWVQTYPVPTTATVLAEVLRLAEAKDVEHLPISDITVVVFTQRQGLALVELLAAKGIRSIHTFAPDDRRLSRQLKVAFYKGSARVKITTIHSFKGLESRALLIAVDAPSNGAFTDEQTALVYTAMSRLKHTPRGAYITVICNHPEMSGYGKTWPDYVPPDDKAIDAFLDAATSS